MLKVSATGASILARGAPRPARIEASLRCPTRCEPALAAAQNKSRSTRDLHSRLAKRVPRFPALDLIARLTRTAT